MRSEPVVIVGGGLAGLCCARVLQPAGIPWMIIEAGDRLGGRVRTDSLDGFLLDVGFQVLLTSYPEAMRTLKYDQLRLGRFQPGALIRIQGRFHRFSDPWRVPKAAISTALAPIGTFADKLRIGKLRAHLARGDLDALLSRPETSTSQRLQKLGFSESMVEGFFRPFFRGVFLEGRLSTSSRKFDYLFRLFSSGYAALPSGGMDRIVRQLAEKLPLDRIRLDSPVNAVSGQSVTLVSGEQLAAQRVVLACDPWNASKLQGFPQPARGYSTAVFYFSAQRPPVEEPVLVLNGDESGPVNSLCVPSQVAEGYAPKGQALVSVSVHIDSSVPIPVCPTPDHVIGQLSTWFGSEVNDWRLLKSFVVENALPIQDHLEVQAIGGQNGYKRSEKDPNSLTQPIVCGDYTDIASIQGAMRSGRLAGELIVKQSGFT